MRSVQCKEIPDKDFALGLHIPGMYDKVLDIDGCWLQSEVSNGILNFTRDFFQKSTNFALFTPKTHRIFTKLSNKAVIFAK